MTEIIKNVFFDEFYLTMVRVLQLTELFKEKKDYKLSIKKMVLFDFYLRFPSTVLEDVVFENFDEKYSFYHWKPNYALYDAVVSILIGKDLIMRLEVGNDKYYKITDKGLEAIIYMYCAYIHQLKETGTYIVNMLSKLSDSKIDEDIIRKSSYINKGVKNNE